MNNFNKTDRKPKDDKPRLPPNEQLNVISQFLLNNSNGRNTHDLSRADIQRRVRSIMYFYNDAINERFKELGVIDYAYKENENNPLNVESRFGEDENYVNYIYNDL